MIKAVIFDMYETLITHYNCPLYFSEEMAKDAGVPIETFRAAGRSTEHERSIGIVTVDEVVKNILVENQCYSEEKLDIIMSKRIETKEECFRHLHPDIVPMLNELKEKNIKIGLISNCFSEEAKVIRESVLFPYFDVVCLSYELGMEKPDERIFRKCMEALDVSPRECLYVGDGGSSELEAARHLGMNATQAVWYLQEKSANVIKRKPDFRQLESPLAVVEIS